MQKKEVYPFGQNVIICGNLLEPEVSGCSVEHESTRRQEESAVISNRHVTENLGFGVNMGVGLSRQSSIYQNTPYLFKTGKPESDTSSRKDISSIGCRGITFETASLVGPQFEKKEKVELMKEISFAIDRLTQKDEDFKVIKRQKLLDKMSVFVDAFTPTQMIALKNDESELSNRLDKIMAIEAMSERLKALPPEERLKR